MKSKEADVLKLQKKTEVRHVNEQATKKLINAEKQI